MSLPSLPGDALEARVTFVAPTVEEKTRTLAARLELLNPQLLLKPGMFADVVIEVPLGTRLAVPDSAVLMSGEHRYVFLDRGEGRLEPVEVSLGVLAGEVPFDCTQTAILRDATPTHPILERIVAIHVAEEARHISFAHSYLGRSVPGIPRFDRFLLSLYVPIVMRMLCGAFLVLPRSFFAQLGIPRGVRRQAFFGDPASRQMLQDMYGDIRMLCYEVDLMNPAARLMWRACRIGGRPSRYRGEPSRHLADAT